MRLRRVVLLAGLVVLVSGLVFGTGSFSTLNTERGVDIAVVDNENGYLNITTVEDRKGYVGGEPFTVVRLANQFPGDVDIDLVSATAHDSSVDIETNTPADVGSPSDPLDVQVRCCDSPGVESVEFSFEVEGAGTNVVVNEQIDIRCIEPEITAVRFDGCGNAQIEADDAVYPLTVTKIIKHPNDGNTSEEQTTIDRDGPIRGSPDGTLIAVEVNGDRYENENQCAQATEERQTTTADEDRGAETTASD